MGNRRDKAFVRRTEADDPQESLDHDPQRWQSELRSCHLELEQWRDWASQQHNVTQSLPLPSLPALQGSPPPSPNPPPSPAPPLTEFAPSFPPLTCAFGDP